MRARPIDVRFWEKVELRPDTDVCWEWRASRYPDGYGCFRTRSGSKGTVGAHRVAFALFGGRVPPGWQIDHLCRNRACCNPYHLEPVTHAENMERGNVGAWRRAQRSKTHCKWGHSLADAYVCKQGKRSCVTCRSQRKKGWVAS